MAFEIRYYTEFPCFLGHPVLDQYTALSLAGVLLHINTVLILYQFLETETPDTTFMGRDQERK